MAKINFDAEMRKRPKDRRPGTFSELLKQAIELGHEEHDGDRCEHGMFYSGAGACPKCGGGATTGRD